MKRKEIVPCCQAKGGVVMGATKIEWCDYTFNHVRGCTKVSPGCANCYAETMSHRNPGTLGVWGPQGKRVVAAEAAWREPLKWDRKAQAAGERHRVFCASLADVFESWDGPMVDSKGQTIYRSATGGWLFGSKPSSHSSLLAMHDVRARLFGLINQTPNLDWLLLTKRPENFRAMLPDRWLDIQPAPNVWLGVSVENQEQADRRIPLLLQVPAAVRFLSCEPLLGPVDLTRCYARPDESYFSAFHGEFCGMDGWGKLHWVIVGGESGHDARPCNLAWIRSIVEQCKAAGVPCFVKQLGAVPVLGELPDPPKDVRRMAAEHGPNTTILRVLPMTGKKGGNLAEFPEDLRVREFPRV